MWRRQFRAVPLWKKGEETFKQPVFVSDVAAGIVAAVKDPYVAGNLYCAVGYVLLFNFKEVLINLT
jgi:NADH dehydrogenase (ubiquinone) 1 alpha subcomplex subunit 9